MSSLRPTNLGRASMKFARTMTSVALLMAAGVAAAQSPSAKLPETPKRPVEDRYFGVTVREDYRWLENWSDPDVKAWSEAENGVTRHYLDSLPDRPAILRRVEELSRSLTPAYRSLSWRGGALFAIKDQPPKQQPMLVRLGSLDDLTQETVLVDPNTLDPTGGTAIDFYEPSLDGSKVAVSLSQGGSESGTVHVYDGKTGAALRDLVPRVQGGTAGGSVTWNADATGFWCTRYPAPGERPEADLSFYQQVYWHKLGESADRDAYVLGKDFPKIAEIKLDTSHDGKWLLVEVLNGDGGEHAFWLRAANGKAFTKVAEFVDRIVGAKFGDGGLYLLSRKDSPNGSILRVPFAAPDLAKAKTVVPASEIAIEDFRPAGPRLYVQDIIGGPSEVRVFDLDGRALGKLPIPAVSSVGGIVHLNGDEVLVERYSYTEPPRWMRYDPATATFRPTALALKSPADYSDVEVRREFAMSKDGTRVPINILFKKGTKLDGSAPALLTGYGGYGLSQRPGFSSTRKLWLEQGGVFAVANIRGGGEYGDAWHLAGNLTKKQNVFDDFAACAQYLVDRHYTSIDRLACQGGSNGGLLMGVMLTHHPELFRAIVSSVGIYDMLRVELSPNGLFNITEFGTVTDSAQFRALHAYSPYHHVRDDQQYPSIMFLTGANDPRVDPMNSRKMTARMQATATRNPVLLRTSSSTGHGIGSPLSARNEQQADIYAFLMAQLGMHWQKGAVAVP